MDDLDRLIEAVEAGDLGRVSAAMVKSALGRHLFPIIHSAVQMGSLDAAKALHDALLPGWGWEGGSFSNSTSVYPPLFPGEDFDAPYYSGESATPARAWLLAVLKAYRQVRNGQ